jgi:hypothetical protein
MPDFNLDRLGSVPLVTWIGIGIIAFYLLISYGAPWMGSGGLSWLVVIGALLAVWPLMSRKFFRHRK